MHTLPHKQMNYAHEINRTVVVILYAPTKARPRPTSRFLQVSLDNTINDLHWFILPNWKDLFVSARIWHRSGGSLF